MNVAIIGSGSWATALAKIVMHNVADINWHIRKQETIDEFMEIRRNPNHLEWAYFDVSRIHFSADINEVIADSDLLILAIPSPYLLPFLGWVLLGLRMNHASIVTSLSAAAGCCAGAIYCCCVGGTVGCVATT